MSVLQRSAFSGLTFISCDRCCGQESALLSLITFVNDESENDIRTWTGLNLDSLLNFDFYSRLRSPPRHYPSLLFCVVSAGPPAAVVHSGRSLTPASFLFFLRRRFLRWRHPSGIRRGSGALTQSEEDTGHKSQNGRQKKGLRMFQCQTSGERL